MLKRPADYVLQTCRARANFGAKPHFTTGELIERAERRLQVMQAHRDQALLNGTDAGLDHLRMMEAEQRYLKSLQEKHAVKLQLREARQARQRRATPI